MRSLRNDLPYIVFEFKHIKDDNDAMREKLKSEAETALQQIFDKQYYAGLDGDIICVGIAHHKKLCELVYKHV